MSDFKLYEHRAFAWSTDERLQEPTRAELHSVLVSLEADGWEDDPVFGNDSGTVNVRRLYRPGRNGDATAALARCRITADRHNTEINGLTRRLEGAGPEDHSAKINALEERLATEVDGLGRILHHLGAEVESLVNWKKDHQAKQPPVGELSSCLGDLLDVEYPDASWKLTIKGGTE